MPWSVVQTYPGAAAGGYRNACSLHELPTALRNLTRQQFTWYNPRYLQKTYVDGIKRFRKAQLFADYVFVQVVDRWLALRSTYGVIDLLMAGEELPATVPDQVVDRIRANEDGNGLVVLGRSGFRLGQSVQVKPGAAFAYERGIFDGQSSRDRVFVLLSCLGASRRVEINEDALIAA